MTAARDRSITRRAYRATEVAAQFNVSPDQIGAWAKAKLFRTMRLGRLLFIPAEDLDGLIDRLAKYGEPDPESSIEDMGTANSFN